MATLNTAILLVLLTLLSFENVALSASFLRHFSTEIRKLQVLFVEDRILCKIYNRTSDLLRAQQSDRDDFDQVRLYLGGLQENLQERAAALMIAKTKEPFDEATYALEETKYQQLGNETRKQMKTGQELLRILKKSMSVKGIEYGESHEVRVQQYFKNERIQKSITEYWTQELKSTDETFYSIQKYFYPIIAPRTSIDARKRLQEKGKRAASLYDIDQLINQTENVFKEIIDGLSAESMKQSLDPNIYMQLRYEDMSEKVSRFKANPRLLEKNPAFAINDIYPAYKTFMLSCNSPLRKEFLVASVIEEALKENLVKHGSSMFEDWLRRKLDMVRGDIMSNPACHIILPDLTIKIQQIKKRYKLNAIVTLSLLRLAVTHDDAFGTSEARNQFKYLKKKLTEDYTNIRSTLRGARDCVIIAAQIENLLHENPPLRSRDTKNSTQDISTSR